MLQKTRGRLTDVADRQERRLIREYGQAIGRTEISFIAAQIAIVVTF